MFHFKRVVLLSILLVTACQSEQDKKAIADAKGFILNNYSQYFDTINFLNFDVYTQVSYQDNKLNNKTIYVCGEFVDGKGLKSQFVYDQPSVVDGVEDGRDGVFVINKESNDSVIESFGNYVKKYCKNETVN